MVQCDNCKFPLQAGVYSKAIILVFEANILQPVCRYQNLTEYLEGSTAAAWGFWCEECGWEAALQWAEADAGRRTGSPALLEPEVESPRDV